MRWIFGLCCLLFLGPAWSQDPFEKSLNALVNDPELASATLGVSVIDLETGAVVSEYQSGKSLVPASVQKLFTTAAALEVFGAEHRFTTTLKVYGELEANGTLHGDLLLFGGGDPSLGSKYFDGKVGKPPAAFLQWADSLKALGVTKFMGSVRTDDSYFYHDPIPSTWIWGDLGNYYGAGPSALTISDNLLELHFTSGAAGQKTKLRVRPKMDWVTWRNEVTGANIRSDQAYVFGGPHELDRYIRGSIPANRKDFVVKASNPSPTGLAKTLFLKALKVRGITVEEEMEPASNTPFGDPMVAEGATIAEIVHWVNRKSVNLFAEHLAVHLGIKGENGNKPELGAKAIKAWAGKHLETEGMFLADGSGLSRFNAISASHLTALLKHMRGSEHGEVFEKSLPVMGVSGSLASMGKGTPAASNLHAKSGYMSRVRSYAGYVKTADGRELAFAVMANNYACSASAMKKKLERWMVSLAR